MKSSRSSQRRGLKTSLALVIAFLLGSSFACAESAPLAMHLPLRPEGAVDAGPIPGGTRVQVTVYLHPGATKVAELDQFLLDLQTPSSGHYHQWLTPAQFGARFGSDASILSMVKVFAEAQGLQINQVAPSGLQIVLSGTATQMEAAFSPQLHAYQLSGKALIGNTAVPQVPRALGATVTAFSGFDTLSQPSTTLVTDASGSTTSDLLSAFGEAVGKNAAHVLAVSTSVCAETIAPADAAAFSLLAKQAAAQGISVVASASCADGGTLSFPASLAEVTSVAMAPGLVLPVVPSVLGARPAWQHAPGLPDDGFRQAPDLTASSLEAFSQTLVNILAKQVHAADGSSARLGNISGTLYSLASEPGLFTQPDGASAGTWEALTGLGVINLNALERFYPNGTLSNNVSIMANNYAPTHGQPVTLTASVSDTSGNGNGAVPGGTITFTSNTGVSIGPLNLNNGTVSTTTNTLPGGDNIFTANYSGDGNYLSGQSVVAKVSVQREAASLKASVAGSVPVGGTIVVTVMATSTSGVGTPMGTISAQQQGTSNSSTYTATLAGSGGTSSATVSLLATQAGNIVVLVTCSPSDQNFSCYNAIQVNATVTQGPTTTTLAVSPNPPVAGQTTTFTASVTGAASPAPLPTGNVTFYDNGAPLGSGTLVNGTATFTTQSLSGTVTHTFTASYNGDNNYLASSANGTSTTATQGPTTTSLVINPTTPVNGSPTTLTATISYTSIGVPPASFVTFYEDGVSIGTANVASNGTATFTSTIISGTTSHTFYAVYNGDTNYAASTSPSISSLASSGRAATTTTLSINPTTPVSGSTTTLTATIGFTSVGTLPTSFVTFYQDGTAIGTANVASNGTATFTSTIISGTTAHTFYAVYNGDTNYAGSTSPSIPSQAAAGRAATTTTLSINPMTPVSGSTTTLTATVGYTSTGTAATGLITFYQDGVSIGTASLGTNGMAVFTSTVISGTTSHVFYAIYNGDTLYAGSTSPSITSQTSTALTATTTSLNVTPSSPIKGAQATLTAQVSYTNNVTPATGTVQFYQDGVLFGTGTLNSAGAAVFSTTTIDGSTAHSFYALYLGDTKYQSSQSVPVATKANTATGPTVTTITAASANPTINVPTQFTATVTPNPTVSGTAPTGNVTFYSSVQGLLGTAPLTGTAATLTVALTTAGSQTITAVYNGDTLYLPSASNANPAVVTVSAAQGTTTQGLTVTPASPIPYGAPVTATVNLTGITLTSGTQPAGTVTFALTPVTAGIGSTVQLVATSATTATATYMFAAPAPGTYTVTATCAGTNFTCSTTALTQQITVIKGNTTTTVSAVPTVPVAGQPTLLTATIAAAAPSINPTNTFTGMVTFYNNGVSLGTGTVNGNTAIFSTTLNTTTANQITAVYSGDANWNTSTSPALSLIAPPIVTTGTLTSNLGTALQQSNVIFTASISTTPTATNPAPGPPYGTVTFYDQFNGQVVTLGYATLVPTGPYLSVAQFSTTGLFAGAHSVTAIYAASTAFAGVTTNAVAVTITDYTLTFNPRVLVLSPGATGTATVTVAAVSGFTGAVVLGCTPPPGSATTCFFNPAQIFISGTSTLTITSTAPHAKASQLASAGATGLGIALAAALGCVLLPRRRRPALFALLVLCGLFGTSGCTVLNNTGTTITPVAGSGTPLGTQLYTITTSGSDGVTTNRHDVQFQVTFQ